MDNSMLKSGLMCVFYVVLGFVFLKLLGMGLVFLAGAGFMSFAHMAFTFADATLTAMAFWVVGKLTYSTGSSLFSKLKK